MEMHRLKYSFKQFLLDASMAGIFVAMIVIIF